MRRREFMAGLAATGAARPGLAQQPAKQHRIAVISPAIPAAQITEAEGGPPWRAVFGELRRLGYVEGQNLIVERYSAEGRRERYADLARQVVASNPDLIIVPTLVMTRPIFEATDTIPIVAALGADPVAYGLVASLARPGRNLTGVSSETGVEVWGKRLQLLKETVPAVSKVAYLSVQINWETPIAKHLRETSRRLGVSLVGMDAAAGVPEELQRVFAAASQDSPDAILVSGIGDLYAHRELVVQLAAKYRLPAIYSYRVQAEAGGLMAYASDNDEVFRRVADYAAQILNGTRPAEMPIYQATRYELVINLKAANALGLTIPSAILAQADEVIE